ncbi:hypothetical protein SDC9_200300 [bioreactor metagenome]|uniref:Uncharacterized protein n=1 Tax=bioreactor metagenome TaxID=1076179 RepID=A0A645IMV5_9ZZZZ
MHRLTNLRIVQTVKHMPHDFHLLCRKGFQTLRIGEDFGGFFGEKWKIGIPILCGINGRQDIIHVLLFTDKRVRSRLCTALAEVTIVFR